MIQYFYTHKGFRITPVTQEVFSEHFILIKKLIIQK